MYEMVYDIVSRAAIFLQGARGEMWPHMSISMGMAVMAMHCRGGGPAPERSHAGKIFLVSDKKLFE